MIITIPIKFSVINISKVFMRQLLARAIINFSLVIDMMQCEYNYIMSIMP